MITVVRNLTLSVFDCDPAVRVTWVLRDATDISCSNGKSR